MGCWLAIDHGSRRIGIAVGRTQDGIASPLEVLEGASEEKLAERIGDLAEEYAAEGVVVGWPLNMDDTEGPQGKKARELASWLASKLELDIRLWDERLSSFQADRDLAGLLTRKKKRRRQDALAAATFLREFLHQSGPDRAPRPSDVGENED